MRRSRRLNEENNRGAVFCVGMRQEWLLGIGMGGVYFFVSVENKDELSDSCPMGVVESLHA